VGSTVTVTVVFAGGMFRQEHALDKADATLEFPDGEVPLS